MRILFVHMNFPAQFRNVASVLGRDPDNEVVFLTMNENPGWNIPGVRKAVTRSSRADFCPAAIFRWFLSRSCWPWLRTRS